MKRFLSLLLAALLGVSAVATGSNTSINRGNLAVNRDAAIGAVSSGTPALASLKSLMVYYHASAAFGNGVRGNLFGGDGWNSTEVNSRFTFPVDLTFSLLGANVIAGNVGDATVVSRLAGATNGTQTITLTGSALPGSKAEDTTHTDAIAAGSSLNAQVTRTGTDPTAMWVKWNIEPNSGTDIYQVTGPSNFTGVVLDAAGATNYFAPVGAIQADGTTTRVLSEWKNRGTRTVEQFQVRATTNDRTTDTVFTLLVNNTPTAMALTVPALTPNTLFTSSGGPITLNDGDLWTIQIAYGAGVEDLRVTGIPTLLKSSTGSEMFFGVLGVARTASATEHFITVGGRPINSINGSQPLSDEQARIRVGFAATVSNLRIYVGGNTYSTDATFAMYVNGVSVLTRAITAGAADQWFENAVNTVTIDADDEVSFSIVGGTSGSLNVGMGGVTLTNH
jgi:hypothetical protein